MVKHFLIVSITVVLSISFAFVAGCESDAATGAGLGGALGAGIGALAGGDTKSTLIGAGIGAGAGYIIGNERDKKKTKAEMNSIRAEMNVVTVIVTNSNGSKSQIRLAKQGVGYVGPKGEYYDHLPTDEELRPLYAF